MAKKSKTRVSRDEEEEEEEREMEETKSKELYQILGVESTATQQEIKKAYYKLALRLHPDKNPGDEEANEKFQHLQKVMSILGDEEKRTIYDQTGVVDDAELAGEDVNNLKEFFSSIYKKVTVADIEEFEAKYRGSDSEQTDLKELYRKHKGNMNRLFCCMLCSDPKLDSHRFKDILDDAVAKGELKETKAYRKWAAQVSKTKPPTDPIRCRSKSKKKTETDLVAIISQRRDQRKEQFESMFTSIIANAGGDVTNEPTEEEFQKAKERLESQNSRAKRKKRRE